MEMPIILNDDIPVSDHDNQRMETDKSVRRMSCPPAVYKIITMNDSILACPLCFQTAIDDFLVANPGQIAGVSGVSSQKSCEVRNEKHRHA